MPHRGKIGSAPVACVTDWRLSKSFMSQNLHYTELLSSDATPTRNTPSQSGATTEAGPAAPAPHLHMSQASAHHPEGTMTAGELCSRLCKKVAPSGSCLCRSSSAQPGAMLEATLLPWPEAPGTAARVQVGAH